MFPERTGDWLPDGMVLLQGSGFGARGSGLGGGVYQSSKKIRMKLYTP